LFLDSHTILFLFFFFSSSQPYFPFIYNISGYPAYYSKYGDDYSYSKCPRAQIFARDVDSVGLFFCSLFHSHLPFSRSVQVTDLDDMKRIMRFNNFQNDPLSLQDPCKSISCRADLGVPWNHPPAAFGAIDCKITDNTIVSKMETKAVSGPTWQSQPPFAWTAQWSHVPHHGHPTVFAFDFVDIIPKHRNE
jgi:hypothetical protein